MKAPPKGVGRLAGLRTLSLASNTGLVALSEGLCSLAGLEVLDLTCCAGVAPAPALIPEGIGRLAGLRALNVSGIDRRSVIALPEGLWSLVGLEELGLRACGLRTLPEGIGRLTRLRKLDLCKNGGLTALPAGLGRLRNLEKLYLFGCRGLVPSWHLILHRQRHQVCVGTNSAGLQDWSYGLDEWPGLPALLARLRRQGPVAAAVES
jgi:Leucine-rich repeat (LRR) protein